MKKIIDGKRYDTKTAEEIAEYSNAFGSRDFRYICESLYKTKNGNYFLAGEGGPMTKYAQAFGDSTGGGEAIIPLCREEAFAWCQEHNQQDAAEEHFGDMIADA